MTWTGGNSICIANPPTYDVNDGHNGYVDGDGDDDDVDCVGGFFSSSSVGSDGLQ